MKNCTNASVRVESESVLRRGRIAQEWRRWKRNLGDLDHTTWWTWCGIVPSVRKSVGIILTENFRKMLTVSLLALTQGDVNVPAGDRTVVTLFLFTYPQGDPNVPAGQVTFDVDLSRPVTDDAQPSAAAGSGKAQEFQIPPAYEARYTNYPHTYLARSVFICRINLPFQLA